MTSKRPCGQTLSGRHVFRMSAEQLVCICGEPANAEERAAYNAAAEQVKREKLLAKAQRERLRA